MLSRLRLKIRILINFLIYDQSSILLFFIISSIILFISFLYILPIWELSGVTFKDTDKFWNIFLGLILLINTNSDNKYYSFKGWESYIVLPIYLLLKYLFLFIHHIKLLWTGYEITYVSTFVLSIVIILSSFNMNRKILYYLFICLYTLFYSNLLHLVYINMIILILEVISKLEILNKFNLQKYSSISIWSPQSRMNKIILIYSFLTLLIILENIFNDYIKIDKHSIIFTYFELDIPKITSSLIIFISCITVIKFNFYQIDLYIKFFDKYYIHKYIINVTLLMFLVLILSNFLLGTSFSFSVSISSLYWICIINKFILKVNDFIIFMFSIICIGVIYFIYSSII